MDLALLKITVKRYITTQLRKVKNYYFSTADYIPSTTLRGAILAEYYYQKGKIEEDFFVSPAYPTNTLPSHYFSPAKERKGKDFIEANGVLNEKEKVIGEGRISEAMKVEGKPKIGALITYKGDEKDHHVYQQFSAESTIQMHVAIDKKSVSSYQGMLFAYEYKKFDELWALAKPSEVIDLVKRVGIGRSKNRVGNIAEVNKVREINLDDPKGLSYCLSQCLPSLFGKKFFDAKTIIGETSLYTGWFTTDTISGNKPVFKTLKEGTLIYIDEYYDSRIMASGLNFILKIPDLKYLLDKVRVQ
ncbi:hypothetical protein DJ531_10090 [Sulfolobus sp. A20-N-F6]|uniref:RAMP superfamily CRISPR-associated protein n=1 Tax=Sulfolobaceae TaxID=118883 RepID=UPI000845C187|nr:MULTISPECIES: RAMP superfamily CRISPR-associated protein [unclassified Sulfolobus]TRM77714.1 hypothetical protein DJ532_03685 [Sulfolobus sp. A20-N-F8]TRM78981.1 hypothetical protein DJ528_03300 [Sulfolobus sp. B5]TRM80373.1 hypothetical protein DJ524_07835 [Sulfolobus sp. D5]TRM81992.1 hypothetical protein DJ531_10090 [Sulfolobus sp. A20-N-F6]TRM86674.1 hypothetical protein DJ529_10675 [Sulfolobus sp. C3]TRM92975.1 hypothetical protein DJ526_04935 [Sulfolobus sp. A20-N-G8]TRM98423.1 hypo